MPIYEYRCHSCGRRVSLLWRSFSDAERGTPICPRCGGRELTRLVSRVNTVRSEESRLDDLADPSFLGDLDENDPRSIGRWMRKMSQELGEDLGDEFNEVVERLEAGQSPEEIEKEMPELMGGEGDFDSGSDFGIGSVDDDL
ncbi:MAG TPA: zinc ribbon domain-containing protein [Caldilineae bacterium]|nr:zinc ribbon domain-containing protein [Caldilineae bacterium]